MPMSEINLLVMDKTYEYKPHGTLEEVTLQEYLQRGLILC